MAGVGARRATHTWAPVSLLPLCIVFEDANCSGIGILAASYTIGRVSDIMYRRYKTKHNSELPPPEKRLDIQAFAYVTSAAGKVMFGWFVLKHYHPAAVLVAASLCMFLDPDPGRR